MTLHQILKESDAAFEKKFPVMGVSNSEPPECVYRHDTYGKDSIKSFIHARDKKILEAIVRMIKKQRIKEIMGALKFDQGYNAALDDILTTLKVEE